MTPTLLDSQDDHLNKREIDISNAPEKEHYLKADIEDVCQICGFHLDQHHEDYNVELIDIMVQFEKAFRQDNESQFGKYL